MSKKIDKLYKMADNKNILIDERCPQKIIAISIKLSDGTKIISLSDFNVNNSEEYTKLECFAHEMGHCVTDSFYAPYSSLEQRGKHEYRANKWAINYIIPFNELCQAVADGNYELWQLAEHFDVSLSFVEKAINFHAQHGKTVPKELYCNE